MHVKTSFPVSVSDQGKQEVLPPDDIKLSFSGYLNEAEEVFDGHTQIDKAKMSPAGQANERFPTRDNSYWFTLKSTEVLLITTPCIC